MVISFSPHRGESLVEGEGFFVAFGLYGIGAALFEGRTSDKTGTATHGEGDGDGIKALAVGIANRDGLVLRNVEADEQNGGLLGCGIGGH